MVRKIRLMYKVQEKLYQEHCSKLVDSVTAMSGNTKEYPIAWNTCDSCDRIFNRLAKRLGVKEHFAKVFWG